MSTARVVATTSTPATRSRARSRARDGGARATTRALPSDPYETNQLFAVAGATFALGACALALASRGDPEPCASCSGSGGDPNPYECTACKGSGLIMCRRCRGTGFVG
ncbi:hypothetical protein BE221DRAFT_210077 [Ostreococcus tauri]|uniref:Heat shock protein DnaJ, cysteine-rich domain n=1 Tax=Ostreococcus tauri TaxID=70448 RepID=A0A1Y5IMT1_OSTTA|nr:hypothetical protein BE221DRAFT_210077 [Ostreococcus tauri]